MIRWLLFAFAFAALVAANSAIPRVEVVRPVAYVPEGQSVTFQIRVDAHPDNRRLVLVAGDEVSEVRRSEEQLDGATAPRTRWIKWVGGLPAGSYVIVGAIFGASGRELARDTHPLTVTP
jgi:hypothetical protein